MYPVNEAFLQAVQENKELQMAKHNLERFLNQQEEEQKEKILSLKLFTYVIMTLKSQDIKEALWNLKNTEMK